MYYTNIKWVRRHSDMLHLLLSNETLIIGYLHLISDLCITIRNQWHIRYELFEI